MNTISFPELNLELNVSSIAFKVFRVEIHWYAIFICIGIIIALFFLKRRDKLYNIFWDDIFDLILYVIPVSFVMARLYYVIFKFEDFRYDLLKIFNFRTGGLAIYGGIIGGIIVTIIYCKIKKINILDMLDYAMPFLALAQSIGRWGNFVNIEAYGVASNLPWRMRIESAVGYIDVHPTFLYEAIATFLIFILLIYLRDKRRIKGQITYIYLITYSFARFFIEGLRIDSLMLFNFRISQILSMLIFVVFGGILIHKSIILKNKKEII